MHNYSVARRERQEDRTRVLRHRRLSKHTGKQSSGNRKKVKTCICMVVGKGEDGNKQGRDRICVCEDRTLARSRWEGNDRGNEYNIYLNVSHV